MTARYIVNGKEYTTQSAFGSSSYCNKSVGSTIDIHYNPNKPSSWGTDLGFLKIVFDLFIAFGLIASLVSLFTFGIRLACILFGWKILKSGRALAKTLPNGAKVSDLVDGIKNEFSHKLFGTTPPTTPTAAVQ